MWSVIYPKKLYLMKKLLFGTFVFLGLVVGGNVAFGATTLTTQGNVLHFANVVEDTGVYVFRADTNAFLTQKYSSGDNTYIDVYTGAVKNQDVANQAYKYVTSTTLDDCSALAYGACVTAVTAGKITEGTFDLVYTLAEMTSNSVAGTTALLGFNQSEVVTKVGTYLKQILGGGLGLVEALIGWIIAIIIISVIVRLIFAGLKWLHILR